MFFQAENHNDHAEEPVELRSFGGPDKSGNSFKDEWITKKTDSVVTKGQKKKRRNKKNSISKTDYIEVTPALMSDSKKTSDEESDGFYLVDSYDCGEVRNPDKTGQRVRFNVEGEDADTVDTEDYNADADTDDPGACSDEVDVDTDVPVTDQDGDTEGYHGDADDTDNYASDRNETATQSHRVNKYRSKSQLTEGIDQRNPTASYVKTSKSSSDKRLQKKKNKKGRSKS